LIYIVIALKSETQAFVERYKLQKTKLKEYTLFFDENIRLIISGMRVVNAREATQALINQYDITDNDLYLNVGICGAREEYPIGSLLEIGEVIYNGIVHSFKKGKKSIVCVDETVSENIYEIVDMESYGFYDAVLHNPAIKNFHILKIVSDHFEPDKVSKDGTKKLISKSIDVINAIILNKD